MHTVTVWIQRVDSEHSQAEQLARQGEVRFGGGPGEPVSLHTPRTTASQRIQKNPTDTHRNRSRLMAAKVGGSEPESKFL